MTKLDAGLTTSLPASDSGSTAVWRSKRINPRPQSCLCLTWSGYPSNDDDERRLHQRQATSTWWCGPLPCTGEGRNGLSIPRRSYPRAILPWTTLLLVFYPCCPMRGHIWTAFLKPIDCPPISTFFRTTLLSPSFHPKPLLYLSHLSLILILMLLISGDIHPNPGPIDSCSVCFHRVTWKNRSVQCTNCSLWVHLSCSGLSPADFDKISPGHSWTCPLCPSSSQPLPSLLHPNPVSSSIHTPNLPSSLTNTQKTISSKMNSHPKTTTNNPTDPSNHPQLMFTYPPSAPQTQHTISPLNNPLSILPLPLEATFEFYSKMLMGFAHVVLNSYNSCLIVSTISSSCKSHTSPLTPLSAYPATKPSK